ncbi:MAG: ArsR/SmtB family transcription factor [Thermoplasmata archaeon]
MSKSCRIKNVEPVDIKKFEDLEEVLKILSNKTRLSILSVLMKYDEVCACELESALQMQQSTITSHLLRLYRAGVLKRREEWKFTYYSLQEKFIPLIKCILKF